MIKNVLVVGGTSAAFLSALALKSKIPDLRVRVIRLKDVDPGENESSTPALTRFLHGYLQIELTRFIRTSRSGWSLGHMMYWGQRDHFFLPHTTQLDQRLPSLPRNNAFYVGQEMDYAGAMFALMAFDRPFFRLENGQPAWHWDIGYQINTRTFVQTLAQLATAIGVEIHEDTLANVKQDANGISALELGSGQRETADLYIDASGVQSLLLGKSLKEPFVSYKSSLRCDRMLIGEWGRSDDEAIHPHTFCDTMESGWSWKLELPTRLDCGYVYSSDFLSEEDAKQELLRKYPSTVRLRTVPIASGRYERAWVKNVVAIGAAQGYVEPLAGSALGVAATSAQLLVETLSEMGREVGPAPMKLFNRFYQRTWDSLRRYLAVHYKYNTRLGTLFWQACRKETDMAGGETIVEYYRQCGPSSLWGPMLIDSVDPFPPSSYLGLLVGLEVPTQFSLKISPKERQIWDEQCERFRAAAMGGVNVVEAVSMLPPAGSPAGRIPLGGSI